MINYKTTFITYINKTSNTFEKKSLEKIALVLTQLMTKLPQLVVPLCSVNLKGKVNLLHLLLCLFRKTSNYPHGYFDEVLKHLITPSAVKAGFNAKTAKSREWSYSIYDCQRSWCCWSCDSWSNWTQSKCAFELGMRIAFSKPVCLIRAKGTAPIFDIDHMLRVYDYNPCLWPSTLESDIPQLSEHIKETWINRRERSYLDILRENKS